MQQIKTDNSYFNEKIFIRIKALPNKNDINILDCFAGGGRLWNEVINQTNKNLKVIQIDKKGNSNIDLIGDNIKYLKTLDLSRFDIIDLDSYGTPFKQLEEIFNKNYTGIIICTFIQSLYGCLPRKMLYKLGYNKQMIDKIPSLFNRKGLDKLINYLYLYDVKQITGYFINRKNYFYFKKL